MDISYILHLNTCVMPGLLKVLFFCTVKCNHNSIFKRYTFTLFGQELDEKIVTKTEC